MRRLYLGVLAIGALGVHATLVAQQAAPAAHHSIADAASLAWKPGSPQMGPGVMVAALHGDPAKDGPFVLRIKVPAGWQIAPHWHPTDENLTVLQGTLSIGTGEKPDAATVKALTVGAYAFMPAKQPHYASAKVETTFQLHGMGPFALTFVNPADDPGQKKTSQ